MQLGQQLAGEQRSLEAVINSSAEYLSEQARQAWAALSLLPAPPTALVRKPGSQSLRWEGKTEEAQVHLQEGLEMAEQYLQEALQIARTMPLRPLLCRVLYQRGLLALQHKHLEEATASFEEILATASDGTVAETALAHFGLARVAAFQGQSTPAHQQGAQALSALEAIGHREASQVRRWLDNLGLDA